MWQFFQDLLNVQGFPPRWNCGSGWTPALGWLHILSDIAIFGAYFAIPCGLAYLMRKRQDVPFPPIGWLFVAFIMCCGVGHLVEATIFWHPWYRLAGVIKLITAVVSWITFIALVYIIPKALELPRLANLNRQLADEVAQRRRNEAELLRLNREVADRSTQVEEVNRELQHRIVEVKHAEALLIRQALEDTLTGLPNRTLLLERLQAAVESARNLPAVNYAVMFLDFDRFKTINDSLGHGTGDELLKQIAVRLQTVLYGLADGDCGIGGHTTARLGGDEFVVLLQGLREGAADVRQIGECLLSELAKPYRLGSCQVYSSASIGIVIGDSRYERAEDVVRDADTAMYEAKHAGKGRFVVFDESMRQRVQRRLTLESDLRQAIENEGLSLAYQPIVSLDSGELKSVEALLRWVHPTEGNISPSEFIPIAEESDLILAIGAWVLREGTRQMAQWLEQLGPAAPPTVSINLSRKQFTQHDLTDQVRATAEAAGLPPERIQLEITEDTFACDVPSAIRAMRSMKELGVKLAIDDFGTGSTSIASLHEFPADVLKLDRSLLPDIEASKPTAAIVHALAILVRNLGMEMIAEGVERESHVIVLRELGCEYGQGFYFAKPLTPEDFARFAIERAASAGIVAGAAAFVERWPDLAAARVASCPASE